MEIKHIANPSWLKRKLRGHANREAATNGWQLCKWLNGIFVTYTTRLLAQALSPPQLACLASASPRSSATEGAPARELRSRRKRVEDHSRRMKLPGSCSKKT